jgi:hypothetical protein
MKSKSANILEFPNELDALFKLPLAEFTGARNTLAAQLKKNGRGDDAAFVKALVKPPISAWAVNQLYWNHREEFDRLLTSGERFHKAQASSSSAKVADMRGALDARRKSLTHLSDLATSLLRNAGHSPSLDTIRRITTTLEAMSVYVSRSDAPRPGRLTHDVDPPGFESLAAFGSSSGTTELAKEQSRFMPSQKSSTPTNTKRQAPHNNVRRLEETRKAKIDAAKVSFLDAKRSLTDARARAQSLAAAQKKAHAETTKAEQEKRDAEERFVKAKAASEDAARRARNIAVEVEDAARAVKYAERIVEKASKELASVEE